MAFFWADLSNEFRNLFDDVRLILVLLLPGLALASILALLASIPSCLKHRASRSDVVALFGLLTVLGLVAYILGFVSANSRETVLGDVVPVLMGGFGALLVYTFVKGQVTAFAAGASALVFSVLMFGGLLAGGQNRDQYANNAVGAIPNFAKNVVGPDQVSQHRSDLVGANASLKLIDYVLRSYEIPESDRAVFDAVVSKLIPRKTYHVQRAFTPEERRKYRILREQNMELDIEFINREFSGDERVLLREIHYIENPLEGIIK